MTNAYADLDTLKSVGVLNITGGDFDTRLLSLLENVSRWIDDHCGRWFYSLTATRHFDGDGGLSLNVPDLIAATALRTDSDGDRVHEHAWTAGDYLLYPLNARPQQPWGRPHARIQAKSAGPSRFPPGRATVEVSGRWGFREVFEDTGAGISQGAPLGPAGTSLTVTDGGGFAAGQTIQVGGEQLYVIAVANNILTVRRGVNGTISGTYVGGEPISRCQYPGAVVEACLLQALLLWQRRDASRAAPDHRTAAAGPGTDPQVQRLLAPYRKLPVGPGV